MVLGYVAPSVHIEIAPPALAYGGARSALFATSYTESGSRRYTTCKVVLIAEHLRKHVK